MRHFVSRFLFLGLCLALASGCRESRTDLSILRAAEKGDLESVKAFVRQGKPMDSVDVRGLTGLQAARARGFNDIAEFLKSNGASDQLPFPSLERLVDGLVLGSQKEISGGLAVLVAREGKIIFEKGYGEANRERGEKAAPGTRFRIGSITKQFTAAAILKLQEEGRLNVKDPLSKYFPGYPRGDEVTLRHLLTHTSGIHSYTSKPDFHDRVLLPISSSNLVDWFKNDPFDFNPGEKWLYSNSGYFLLGLIVEKVSGKPLEEFLKSQFFEPLGMADTGACKSNAVLAHEALGYSFENGKLRRAANWDMSWAGGAGVLYSTVEDLFKWNEGIFNGRVLKPESLEAAWSPVKMASADAVSDLLLSSVGGGYGLGWVISDLRGARMIEHNGGLDGFQAHLLRVPQHQFTVAVLCNVAPPPPRLNSSILAHDIAELTLGDKLAPRTANQTDKSLDPKTFSDYIGSYDLLAALLHITREGDHLFSQLPGQTRVEIFPQAKDRFFMKEVDARLEFHRNARGKVDWVDLYQNQQKIKALRMAERKIVKVSPEMLRQYEGDYEYGGTRMHVTREGEHLFAQLQGQEKFEIFPESESDFFWKVVNAQISFVRGDDGRVSGVVHRQSGQEMKANKVK